VQSAVKKTVLSAWVSVLTRMNASQLQTLVLQCLLPESVTSTANILPTGRGFETLAAVKEKVGDMPLVLHGGTGIPEDMIKKAISLGVAKINVNTECQLAFAAAVRKYIEAGKDLEGKGFDPRKLLAPGCDAIKETVREKIELFGSANKA